MRFVPLSSNKNKKNSKIEAGQENVVYLSNVSEYDEHIADGPDISVFLNKPCFHTDLCRSEKWNCMEKFTRKIAWHSLKISLESFGEQKAYFKHFNPDPNEEWPILTNDGPGIIKHKRKVFESFRHLWLRLLIYSVPVSK